MSSRVESVLESKYKPNDSKFDNISRYLFESLQSHKQKDLIIDHSTGVTLNGQQILNLSRSVAKSLTDNYNAKSGEVFCLFCPNHYFRAIALISIWSIGGVVIVLNEKTSYGDIENIVNKTQFKYLFCGKHNENIATKLASNYPQICNVFTTYEESEVTSIAQLMNYGVEDKEQFFGGNASVVALIELTGGTNDGIRKLVTKTQSNLVSAICQMQNNDILSDTPEETVLSVPFDRLFGVEFFLSSLTAGSKIVIVDGTFDSNAPSYLESISKHKVTKLVVTAPDMEMLVNNEVNLMYNISSIKEIIHLGVFRDYDLLRQRVDNMFKCRYFRGVYGTTESGIISCLYKSRSFERNCYSVGKLIPGTEVKVIDVRTGKPMSAYGVGEICVKNKQLSLQYYSNNTINKESHTSDGFFRTGDCGYYDNDHNLYVECRLSDVVAIEDHIYLPNELQILLLSHPNVSEVAVVATYQEYSDDEDQDNCETTTDPNNKLNNTFKIFVVLKPGSETNDLDLINYVNDRVEPIKQIDSGLYIVDMLPRNYLGVINRSALVKF